MRAACVLLPLLLCVCSSAAVQVKVSRTSLPVLSVLLGQGFCSHIFRLRALKLCCVLALLVQVGDRSFPLEAVKQLKQLLPFSDEAGPHLSEASVASVCTHPLLPQLFRPVCQGRSTGIVLSRLGEFAPPTLETRSDSFSHEGIRNIHLHSSQFKAEMKMSEKTLKDS